MHVKFVPMSQKINDVASTNMDRYGLKQQTVVNSCAVSVQRRLGWEMRVQPTLLNKCWWCPLKGYQALPNSVNWLRRVSRVEIEAVFSKAVQEIAWRDLQDDRVWRQGWVWWVGEVSCKTTLQHQVCSRPFEGHLFDRQVKGRFSSLVSIKNWAL